VKLRLVTLSLIIFGLCGVSFSQSKPKKQLLVIGEQKGYRHQAVSHAMATIERMGEETGLWETTIRTDTEVLTKRKLEFNAKNLNDFDAVLFFTSGELEMNAQQKSDLLSFVHDDGKGFIGVHSATITFTEWPEYGKMIGGYFDEHPWGTFEAPSAAAPASLAKVRRESWSVIGGASRMGKGALVGRRRWTRKRGGQGGLPQWCRSDYRHSCSFSLGVSRACLREACHHPTELRGGRGPRPSRLCNELEEPRSRELRRRPVRWNSRRGRSTTDAAALGDVRQRPL